MKKSYPIKKKKNFRSKKYLRIKKTFFGSKKKKNCIGKK